MSNSSKIPKSSSDRSDYFRFYNLEYQDINDDFYHLVDNDLLMKLIEAKRKKNCPSDVEYIVIDSDSDDDSDSNKTSKSPCSDTPAKNSSDENVSCVKIKSILPVDSGKEKNTNDEVLSSQSSSSLLITSSTAENNDENNSRPKNVIVNKSGSNEKIKDSMDLVENLGHLESKSLTPCSNENQDLGIIASKTSSPEKSSQKKCANLAKKSYNDEKSSQVFSSDEENEFSMNQLGDDMKSSENEYDSDEMTEKFIKKEWCICSNSQNKENLKLCDECGQWFHIMCAADEATIKKVTSGHKVSLIDDFKCLLCRNDKEAMKKFDTKIIEQRIRLRNERMPSDSDEDRSSRKIFISANLDEDQMKKSLNEKKQLVKERTQEQKKTKLLSDTADNYHQKKNSQKVITPTYINYKTGFQGNKKTDKNSLTKRQNFAHGRLDHTPKRFQNEIFKMNKSTTPSEPKSKLNSIPNTTSQKLSSKVIADREKTKSMLAKSFKERIEHVDELKVSQGQIDLLCDKIEREIYQQFGNSHEYIERIKVIRLNVNEKSNKTFYKKILNGSIRPDQLPLMDKNEMKDDDLRRQDEENRLQDLIGRIEQSADINEDRSKFQETLRIRKGIDDDLSALGSFIPAIDVNNNDKEAHTTQLSDQSTSKSSAECVESVDVTLPVVIERLSDKKRKHDSDYESDHELQPFQSKQTRSNEPVLDISLTNICVANKPLFKISSDIVWTGSLNLNSTDISFKLKVNMLSVNDFGPTSNRLKVLESFKQRLIMNAITDFKLVEMPYINVWTLNPCSYLVFKFEPNMNLKSQFQPQYMTSLKDYESNEVLIALYEKMNSMKPSSFTYLLQLPKALQDLIDKIILFPVRKSPNEPDKEFDLNMKKNYGIVLNRSVDSVLGFMLPKIRSSDAVKKNSPDQTKTTEKKDETKDPRMRKVVRTSPPQVNEKNGKTCAELVKNPTQLKSRESCANENGNANGHKVISLDVYKQKHKINSDLIEPVPMDIDSLDDQPVLESKSKSENFILINTILASIGSDTSQQTRLDILDNMRNLSILKLLTKQEINELRQKYESSLPEFVQILVKSTNETNRVKEVHSEIEKKDQSGERPDQSGSGVEEKKKSEKMLLPPKHLWQGPSKESFDNLLKLHKASKERQSSGQTYDLTLENNDWNLDEKSFRTLDEKLLNVPKEDRVSSSESETYISTDEMSSNESFGYTKRTNCTARKSVSGLRTKLPTFRLKDNKCQEKI